MSTNLYEDREPVDILAASVSGEQVVDEMIEAFFKAAEEWFEARGSFILIPSQALKTYPEGSRAGDELRAQMRYLMGAAYDAV